AFVLELVGGRHSRAGSGGGSGRGARVPGLGAPGAGVWPSAGRIWSRSSLILLRVVTLKSLAKLKSLLRAGEVTFDPAILSQFAADKWFAAHQPDAVAVPRSTQSVSKILRFANRHNVPVTPRGGGYGYVGGCVPVQGGIVLSLEGLNRILEISTADFVAVVQAGVNTQKLQARVEKLGLFYPP